MAVGNGSGAPQVRPWEVRVGDVIGTGEKSYTVELIGGPQTAPKQWTFFGRDRFRAAVHKHVRRGRLGEQVRQSVMTRARQKQTKFFQRSTLA